MLEHHLKVWKETCGGAAFMGKGMRPYWIDAHSPARLEKLPLAYERPLRAREEEAFGKMIADEMKEGMVIKIRRDQVRFLNPTFPVPKPKGKWRKVVDCRRLNAEQGKFISRWTGRWWYRSQQWRRTGRRRTTSPTRSTICW
jgi:hypothetical protein